MMHFTKLFTVTLLTLAVSSVSAQALELKPVVGMNLYSITDSAGTASPSAKVAFGFGGLVSASLVPMLLDLEAGALYMNRKYEQNVTVTTTTSTSIAKGTLSANSLQFPLVARLTALPFLSPGLGFYYATLLGDQSLEVSNLTLSYTPSTRSDYGLVGSAQVKFPLLPLLSLLGDVRYNFGLKDNSGTKTRELQILAGASLGF